MRTAAEEVERKGSNFYLWESSSRKLPCIGLRCTHRLTKHSQASQEMQRYPAVRGRKLRLRVSDPPTRTQVSQCRVNSWYVIGALLQARFTYFILCRRYHCDPHLTEDKVEAFILSQRSVPRSRSEPRLGWLRSACSEPLHR